VNSTDESSAIDREKLRARLRLMGQEYVYYMLADAMEMLTDDQLATIASRYVPLEQLMPDGPVVSLDLLAEIQRFAQASRRGDYYEDFLVDSRNCTQLSGGTAAWISDLDRHLRRCMREASGPEPRLIVEAFEVLFDLVRLIDSGSEEILFFADEGGSWLFGIDWPKTIEAYASCLARICAPAEFAAKTVAVIDEFERHDRERLLAVASRVVADAHRDALATLGA
jgi:hypothetical protein